MTSKLNALMAGHAHAAQAFRRAIDGNLGAVAEDDAFEGEALVMMALCAFPPDTIEEARVRARYLFLTRFVDDLTAEGRAFLHSLT